MRAIGGMDADTRRRRRIGIRQYGLFVALLAFCRPIGIRQYGLFVALLAFANTGFLSPYWHSPIRAADAVLAFANTGFLSPYWHSPIRAADAVLAFANTGSRFSRAAASKSFEWGDAKRMKTSFL